jgi:dihydrofolate reductase
VFIGTSVDGFIARRDGAIDWLPTEEDEALGCITRVPVLIGDGTPLFGSLPHDVKLRHVATRAFASGLVQSTYDVAGV